MTEYTRTSEREKTMQALYQVFALLEGKSDFDATEIMNQQYGVADFSQVPPFSKAVYALALNNIDEIQALISKYLVGWTFKRLDNVAKGILVEAVAEGNYGHLTPRKVIISEAVNLAKNYLEPKQSKFINAVLDKALEQYDVR